MLPAPRSWMFFPDSIHRHTLANGLTVLVRRDTSAPVAAVVTWVKAGYFDETDDQVGIAHVLEHMYFKGTPTRGVGQIARETKASGGYLNAHTIYDHTAYYAVLPRDGFARGLEIQADAYAHSLIDASELARELEVIIQEAKRKEDTPAAVARETLYELLHDRHRMRRWRIGREEGLRAMTREHVVGFYRNFYRPSSTILVIVGDIDVDETLRQVERLYGQIEPGAPIRFPGPLEEGPPGFRYRELVGDVAQTQVVLGWRTPPTLDPDTPPLDIAADILGTGRGSRLYRSVREQRLASSVSAANYTPVETGVFDLHLECPPECARAAVVEAWAQVRDLAERGPSPDEVERVRRLFEARLLRRLETMNGQAMLIAEWESLGDWRLVRRYVDRMMSVTAPEVREVVERHLDPGQVALLVYRPEGGPALASGGEEARALLNGGRGADAGGAAAAATAGVSAPPAVHTRDVILERREGRVSVYRTRQGLPVLVLRRAGAPVAHVGVFTAAGSALEPDPVAGVATVMARAAIKGTKHRDAAAIAYASELLGGSIAPSVTADETSLSISVPGPRVAEAAALLGEVVQEPRFDDETIETERAIALAQLAQLRDDMMRYPLRLVASAAFGSHPYGRGTLGTESSLHAIRGADVWAAHERHLRNAPVVLAGVADLDEEALASLLASHFAALEYASPEPLPVPSWPPAIRTEA
ncbi:MAG TPA: pitrilysin family protein, partial [Gemmatimonadaceae bacterium]